MIPRVAILLAGFNGQAYIYEQVFSLLNQKSIFVDIYIRVDGVSESFLTIIEKLSAEHLNIHFLSGDHFSTPASNFYNLIMAIKSGQYDYYAFCDQDDIWKSDRIINAISHFNGDSPQGFSSGYTAVYSNGNKFEVSLGRLKKYDHYFQSAGPGCTFVLNNLGYDFLRNFLIKNKLLMCMKAHDWLIYFIFRFNDLPWLISNDSGIYYRQHSCNVAGVNKGVKAKLKRINILFHGWFFHDLGVLIKFAIRKNKFPLFLNPTNLRRDLLTSIIMWLYFWFYFRIKNNVLFKSNIIEVSGK